MRITCYMTLGFEQLARQCAGHDDLELICACDADTAARSIAHSDALITFAGHYSAAIAASVAAAPRLRWLHFATAGVDPLWVYPPPARVTVSGGGAVWADSVAEHAVALALAAVRCLPRLERDRAAAAWRRHELMSELGTLRGQRVALLGFGAIGQAIARLLQPFGVQPVAVATRARHEAGTDVLALAGLAQALTHAAVVFLALPLTPRTEHLLDAAALALLPPGALIVNVGRARLVDETALLAALQAKRVRAALDVFETEPLPASHPYWRLANVILSPHVAGFGDPALAERLACVCRENIEDVLAGRTPRNAIAPQHLARPAAPGDIR